MSIVKIVKGLIVAVDAGIVKFECIFSVVEHLPRFTLSAETLHDFLKQ